MRADKHGHISFSVWNKDPEILEENRDFDDENGDRIEDTSIIDILGSWSENTPSTYET